MILNKLDVVIEPADIQKLLARVADGIDKVKELSVNLENGIVVLKGKISVGFTIPFSTRWKINVIDDGYQLSLTLSGLSVGMAGVGEEMISGQILTLLKNKLEDYESITVRDKSIVIDIKKAIQLPGLSLTAPVQGINVTPAGIELVV